MIVLAATTIQSDLNIAFGHHLAKTRGFHIRAVRHGVVKGRDSVALARSRDILV